MSFEWLKIEENWNWEKIEKSQAEIKLKEIWELKSHMDNMKDSSDPEIKQKLESNTKMQWEIVNFLENAANNKLSWWLDKFNSQNFDKDNESWLDNFEFSNFEQAVNGAIDQIIVLEDLDKVKWVYDETSDKWWLNSPDKWLANKVWVWDNMNELIKWRSFTQEWLKKLWLSEENIKKMSEKQFDMNSTDSWKELWILTTKELWEWAESILKLLLNVVPGIILLPRYMSYRVESNSNDPKEAQVWEIKLNELTSQNPSLQMLDLLWEKWVEMLQKLWEMVKSWKQWDIAMMLVSIAWLIAWWAGLAKSWLWVARKEMVMEARRAWREWRNAAWRETRNTIRDLWNQAWKVEKTANSVDDTLSWVNAIKSVWKVTWWLWANEAWKQIDAANDATNKIDNLSELWDKEKLYYSNFSNEIPEVLKSENPVAWINKDWTISYNKNKLEENFWVKIEWEQWKTTFDWKSLKEYIKENPEKWKILMEELKNLKWHESTHRLLESHWVDRVTIKVNWIDKIIWQEAICHIVDWSLWIWKEELSLLEKALQEKIWPDFKLDSNNIRISDTKNITNKWNEASNFKREKEAAKSPHEVTILLWQEIRNIQNNLKWKLLTLADWNQNKADELFNSLFWTKQEKIDWEIMEGLLTNNNQYLWEMKDYFGKQESRIDSAINQKKEKALKSTENTESLNKIGSINNVDDMVKYCQESIPNFKNSTKTEVEKALVWLTDEQIWIADKKMPWFKDAFNRVKDNKIKNEHDAKQWIEKQEASDSLKKENPLDNSTKNETYTNEQNWDNQNATEKTPIDKRKELELASQKYNTQNSIKNLETGINDFNQATERLQDLNWRSYLDWRTLQEYKQVFIKSETQKLTQLLEDANLAFKSLSDKPNSAWRSSILWEKWVTNISDISNILKWTWNKILFKDDIAPIITQLENKIKEIGNNAENLTAKDADRFKEHSIEQLTEKLWNNNLEQMEQQLATLKAKLNELNQWK